MYLIRHCLELPDIPDRLERLDGLVIPDILAFQGGLGSLDIQEFPVIPARTEQVA